MWSEERYDYERLPRERLPPRCPDDDYHRVVSFGLKKPTLLDRPGEGSYDRYEYGHAPIGYRQYEEGRSFAHERSGPPHRNDDPGYRLPREEHPASRQPDYRDLRDGSRRKSIYPHYARDRSPHKRDSPYFRESPVSRRDSPHSRSGSSVSSRSYSPDRSKVYAFHQSQHSRSTSSLHKRRISHPGKERPSHSLKTSKEVSPSGTTAVPPSKALDKSSRLTEKELEEAASRWAAEKDKADASIIPEITDFNAVSSEQLYEHHEETGVNITDNNELFEDSQHASLSKAISAKTKEIEQELFGYPPAASDPPVMSSHQGFQNPIPNLTLEQPKPTRRSPRRPRNKPAHHITWGDIKALTCKAQHQLVLMGETETPEKLFVAMLAEITKNSLSTDKTAKPSAPS